MYTTLTKVKTYLWITWTADDTRLSSILGGIEAFVFNIIWDINTNDKTETICVSLINKETFPLTNKKVTQIKTVNWTDFTAKVNWTDYLIRTNDTVTITWISGFISNLVFNVFDIVYTSGYVVIPFDLENAIAELVWFTFAKDLWKNITSEQTWPRRVVFWSEDTTDTKVNEALTIINNYQVLNLKHFI